jgi:hypothetical protein
MAMAASRNTLRYSIYVLYAAIMLYAVVLGFTKPWRNWDIIGYVGSVIDWQENTPDAVYANTMATLRANLPDLYDQFTGNPLSATQKAFMQVLPIYEVKPLYVALMWLVSRFGVALTTASWVVSALCFAALAALLFAWRPRYMARDIWLVLILALSYLGPWPMTTLSRFSTPDALCTLLVIAALYSWLQLRSYPLFCVMALLAVLARVDALIVMGAFAVYFALFAPAEHRSPLRLSCGLIAALLVTYAAVSHAAHSYSWNRLFVFVFMDRSPTSLDPGRHLTWDFYWYVISSGAHSFITYPRNIAMLAFTAFACFGYFMKPASGNRVWLGVLGVTWASLAVRFCLFPGSDDRYYFVYYLAIIFASGELITPYLAELGKMMMAHRARIQNG